MTWLIVRTDARKEAFVARQVQNIGFDAWVPAQVIVTRNAAGRRMTAKAVTKVQELPILPRRVFIRSSWPCGNVAVGIRHVVDVERDSDERIIFIPDSQVAIFKAAIDEENTAALALAQKAGRKQKAKWKNLRDALLDLIDAAKEQLRTVA